MKWSTKLLTLSFCILFGGGLSNIIADWITSGWKSSFWFDLMIYNFILLGVLYEKKKE